MCVCVCVCARARVYACRMTYIQVLHIQLIVQLAVAVDYTDCISAEN